MTVLHDADEVLLAFARAVRAAGVPVTHDRSASFLEATALVGLGDVAAVRTAGHATLCARRSRASAYPLIEPETSTSSTTRRGRVARRRWTISPGCTGWPTGWSG